MLWAVVAVDQFCGGLAIATFSVYLLVLCNPRYGATQNALLTGASGLVARLVAGASGFVAERYGWPTFFHWRIVLISEV